MRFSTQKLTFIFIEDFVRLLVADVSWGDRAMAPLFTIDEEMIENCSCYSH